jgi:beta-glucosidase-like glycosyl hydrolase
MEPLKLEDLSVEQKIGQMLLARTNQIDGNMESIFELAGKKALGGVHLTIEKSHLITELNETAGYPILICDNMERGFKGSAVQFPPPLAVGAADDEELAYQFGALAGRDAKHAGFNVVFGPVTDIAMNPLASCVGVRAFGGDKVRVARITSAVIRGCQDQGMIVTAKHYPGFGESHVDSHIGMVYLTCDEETLIKRELYPYLEGMKNAGLTGIMTGHIMVSEVDPEYPASVSKKLIGLIRERGFDGLLITDSLAMVGMTNIFGIEECHCLAMAAGNDMVMTSYRITAREAYGYMMRAYREGNVTEEQIDRAAGRVLTAQARTLAGGGNPVKQEEWSAAAKISRKSITAVTAPGAEAAVDPGEKHLFILETSVEYLNPEPKWGYRQGHDPCGIDVVHVEKLISELFPESDIIKAGEFPSRGQMERCLAETMNYQSVIMVVFNQAVAYMGSSDLTKRMLALMGGISHKLAGVVLFGGPYAAREFPPVPRIIFGYDGKLCERAALRVLAGKEKPKGTIPVPLELPPLRNFQDR